MDLILTKQKGRYPQQRNRPTTFQGKRLPVEDEDRNAMQDAE
jgi:hypothetical protein